MALSEDDLDILRSCIAAATREPELAAEYFHEELFRMAPQTRVLYRNPLKRQGLLLMNRLGIIMSRMHDISQLRPFVEDLAIRHVGYGVLPEHYPIVREALVAAFSRVLGTAFTPEAEQVLKEAYDNVAAIMLDIADQKGAPQQA